MDARKVLETESHQMTLLGKSRGDKAVSGPREYVAKAAFRFEEHKVVDRPIMRVLGVNSEVIAREWNLVLWKV